MESCEDKRNTGADPGRRAVLLGIVYALCGMGARGAAAEAVKSGPQEGQKLLPFTSNMVTGPERGKQHCYI